MLSPGTPVAQCSCIGIQPEIGLPRRQSLTAHVVRRSEPTARPRLSMAHVVARSAAPVCAAILPGAPGAGRALSLSESAAGCTPLAPRAQLQPRTLTQRKQHEERRV